MIPQEAVEAACDDWFSAIGDAAYPDAMRAALEAAAPFIRAQALDHAAAALRQVREDIDPWGKPTVENYADWIVARAATERGQG